MAERIWKTPKSDLSSVRSSPKLGLWTVKKETFLRNHKEKLQGAWSFCWTNKMLTAGFATHHTSIVARKLFYFQASSLIYLTQCFHSNPYSMSYFCYILVANCWKTWLWFPLTKESPLESQCDPAQSDYQQ